MLTPDCLHTYFSYTFTETFPLHACGVTRNLRTYFTSVRLVFLVETRIADCTVRHPGVERPFSSFYFGHILIWVGRKNNVFLIIRNGKIILQMICNFEASFMVNCYVGRPSWASIVASGAFSVGFISLLHRVHSQRL